MNMVVCCLCRGWPGIFCGCGLCLQPLKFLILYFVVAFKVVNEVCCVTVGCLDGTGAQFAQDSYLINITFIETEIVLHNGV